MEAAGQKVSVPKAPAVGPTRKLVLQTWNPRGCRPGWEVLARMLRYLREELWALEHQMLGPGILETAGLAGWELARMLAWLVAELWALEHQMLGLGEGGWIEERECLMEDG